MHGKLFEASALAIIITKVHLSDHVGTYKSCNVLTCKSSQASHAYIVYGKTRNKNKNKACMHASEQDVK